uniref:Uncharacterized protein n=1 Tax=Myotis myotis TaxID=51298 RepID=A0A7J7S1X7_MYOMY|nr:hypothetical protein mMyoMyo1_010036 [Myotis myotis]
MFPWTDPSSWLLPRARLKPEVQPIPAPTVRSSPPQFPPVLVLQPWNGGPAQRGRDSTQEMLSGCRLQDGVKARLASALPVSASPRPTRGNGQRPPLVSLSAPQYLSLFLPQVCTSQEAASAAGGGPGSPQRSQNPNPIPQASLPPFAGLCTTFSTTG